MGRKHVTKLDLFKGEDRDMSGPLTSREIDVSELDKASIHCYFDAGNEGTVEVQVQHYSEYPEEDTWMSLTAGQTPWEVEAADEEILITLTEVPFVKLRLVWTPTSGTGDIVAYLTAKSQGA
jgi:hypothetical protein